MQPHLSSGVSAPKFALPRHSPVDRVAWRVLPGRERMSRPSAADVCGQVVSCGVAKKVIAIFFHTRILAQEIEHVGVVAVSPREAVDVADDERPEFFERAENVLRFQSVFFKP